MEPMAENEIKDESKGSDSRIYEVGYLLSPAIEGADVPIEYTNLKDMISSFRGELIADDMPKNIELAYTMEKLIANVRHKFNSAYFGWVKFAMDPDKVIELKKKLELDPKIVRFLIMKTVRENTVAAKRFIRGDAMRKRAPVMRAEGEEAPAINKEEIDKEIDAMVSM